MAHLNSYSVQNISSADRKRVSRALASEYLTQGGTVTEFEEKCAAFCGSKYALAVSSATAGLHLTLLALELNRNSLVWASANSFVSTANVVRLIGAELDFVDIDPETWVISPETLELKILEKLTLNERLPDVVILVHFAGLVHRMPEFDHLAQKYNFRIVEDAAHAFGSKENADFVGGTKYSNACVFSFHAIKPMTTGEGGLITTNCSDFFESVKMLRSHGITKNQQLFKQKNDEPWYYEQHSLGYNYRITDFQCALGISQIGRYYKFLKKRARIVSYYQKLLNPNVVKFQKKLKIENSSNHIFPILVNPLMRKNLYLYLQKHGIGVNVHYIPIYKQPFYAKDFQGFQLENTEKYYKQTITLPLHTYLTKAEVSKVSCLVNNYLEKKIGRF